MTGHSEYSHFTMGRKGAPAEGQPMHRVRAEDGAIVGCDGTRYRETPGGEPGVPGLVRPGDAIRTSYGTGGIVMSVEEHLFCPCPHEFHSRVVRKEHAGPHCHPIVTHSISYRDAAAAGKKPRLFSINETVAVGGRILFLFEENRDEVTVERSSEKGV